MENKPEFSISLSDGKYTYQRLAQGSQRLLRYGEPWPAADTKIIGDNVLLAFGYAAEDLQTRVSRLEAFIQYMFDDAAKSAVRWEVGPHGPLGEKLRVRAQAVKVLRIGGNRSSTVIRKPSRRSRSRKNP